MKKPIVAFLVLITLVLGVSMPTQLAMAAVETADEGAISNNSGGHDYDPYWGDTVYSYLVQTTEGYMRVESQHVKDLTVEYFDSYWNLTSKKIIPMDLDWFGGFYASKDYYYVFSWKQNPKELEDAELIRVTKYNKNWEKVQSGSLSVKAIEVMVCGASDILEYNGELWVYTNRTFLKKQFNDGKNHEASLLYTVRTSDMLITERTHIRVSHTFNQFIDVTPDGTIVVADHGDAFPSRAVILHAYTQKDLMQPLRDYPKQDVPSKDLIKIRGEKGDNYTGVTLGGMKVGNNTVLTVGTSVTQNESFWKNKDYNVFLAVAPFTPKSNTFFGKEEPKITWLTQYPEGTTAGNPYLLKLNKNKFIVMWNKKPITGKGVLCYAFIDGSGKVGEIKETEGTLSDCEPVVSSTTVMWYATQNSSPVMYSLDTLNGRMVDYGDKYLPENNQSNSDNGSKPSDPGTGNTPNTPVNENNQKASKLQINNTKCILLKGQLSTAVRAYFSDNKQHRIEATSSAPEIVKVGTGNSLTGVAEGKAIVTFTSEGQSVSCEVIVIAYGVSIVSPPNKTIYTVGEAFDPTGFSAVYSDGHGKITLRPDDVKFLTNNSLVIKKGYIFKDTRTTSIKAVKGNYAAAFSISVSKVDVASTLKDGWYNIQCMNNVMTVSADGGVELRYVDPKPTFYVERKSDGKYVIKTADGKYLGIAGDMKDGVQVKAVKDEFYWIIYSEGGNGCYSFRPYGYQKLVMNAAGEKNSDGTWIILWTHEKKDAPINAEFYLKQ